MMDIRDLTVCHDCGAAVYDVITHRDHHADIADLEKKIERLEMAAEQLMSQA